MQIGNVYPPFLLERASAHLFWKSDEKGSTAPKREGENISGSTNGFWPIISSAARRPIPPPAATPPPQHPATA